jgi:Cu(I)/Ag(I) efflux system membrane protein CusA/SilA
MAAAAVLAVTLVPWLMGYFIRGKVLPEKKNPINRGYSNGAIPGVKRAISKKVRRR